LQALMARGERPSFIVGASAGAINGAFFAAEPTAAGVDKLDRLWRALRRRDVFPLNLRSVMGLFARGHLVDSTGLRRLIEHHLPYQQLEGAAVPIPHRRVRCTNTTTDRRVSGPGPGPGQCGSC
jgi:NTE family protein